MNCKLAKITEWCKLSLFCSFNQYSTKLQFLV